MDSKKVIFLESEEDGTIDNLTKSINDDNIQFDDQSQFDEDDNDSENDNDNVNDIDIDNDNNNLNENNTNLNKNNTNLNENNNVSSGGNGSDSDSDSDGSVKTDDILAVDPMYVRLTKFLETNVKLEGGGTQTKNITEILSDLSDTFKKFNQNFAKVEKYMENLSIKQ